MTTTRLGLPTPGDADPPNGPDQITDGNTILDDALLWDQGTYASRPATGAVPFGFLYRQTDSGGGYPAGTFTINTSAGWLPVNADGSILTAALADDAVTNAKAAPTLAGQEVASGYAALTSTVSATTTTFQNIVSITVTGDNVNPMMLEGFIPSVSAASSSGTVVRMIDDAVKVLAASQYGASSQNWGSHNFRAKVAAFSGSKTFRLQIADAGGGGTSYAAADSGAGLTYAGSVGSTFIRATWGN